MSDNEELAVVIENVSKDFVLPNERSRSIKSTLLNFGRGRSNTQHALRSINLSVKKGEFFGIVGRNGSGKSTLLKILAGIYQPTTGSVQVNGSLVPFIELGVGFNQELSGRDNVFLNGALLGFSRREMEEMYDSIVKFAELERFMDQKLKNYSSGMQVRLAFSIAIRAHTDILLIDEVLAVGDSGFQEKCFNIFKQLKADGKTIIFISHDMRSVEQFCDRVMVINKGDHIATGETKEMITKYGSIVAEHEIELEKANSAIKKPRVGNDKAKITAVALRNSKGKEVEVINESEPFSIEIDYNSKVDQPNSVVSVSIFDTDENKVIASTTVSSHADGVTLKKGKGSFTASFEGVSLAQGRYTINVGFFAQNLIYAIDHFRDAKTFRVNGKKRTSILAIDPQWRVGKIKAKK